VCPALQVFIQTGPHDCHFKDKPEVFMVHGEEETALSFGDLVAEKYGFKTHVPEKGEVHEL